MIIGHSKNLEFLEKAIENKTIAQALCFTGPDEVGKKTLAEYLSSKILGIPVEKLATHPDYLLIEKEIDEKKNRLNKNINLAQAKKITSFLQKHSWLGKTKIVLINEAESLNIEAANALLKTLEDLTEESLVIFLTLDVDFLPVTIKSRSQIINFYPVAENEMIAGLIKLGFSEEDSLEVLKISWGRPGRAINFLKNKDNLLEYKNELERLNKIINQPFHLKLKLVDDLFGDKEDPNRGRDNLKKIMDLWIMVWRDVYKENQLLNLKKNPLEVLEIIDSLQETKEMLEKNIHPRLLIERILLKI